MSLRIHRSWKWVSVPTGRMGGQPPSMHLEAVDVLEQFRCYDVNGMPVWEAIEIVEDMKPEKP